MEHGQRLARLAAITAGFMFVVAAPVSILAQETPVALEQARSGEDGTSGAGASSGNMSSGNAKRDKNGNAGSASVASAGSGGAADDAAASSESLPENAELLAALGILDDVTMAGIDVLTGLEIPLELLPAPVEGSATSAPSDINTGGQGGSGQSSSSTISTDPGTGSAPAGGATSSAAEDGEGNSGQRNRDRPRKDDASG
jgi:hypothetical protein